MKDLLLRHNIGIYQQIKLLMTTVINKVVPDSLSIYKDWLITELNRMQRQTDINLLLLKKNNQLLIPDVLSDTELLSQDLGFLNSSFVPPLHRGIASDEIGLKLLEWMHKSHPLSSRIPFAISDGSFSIYPVRPTLYYLPIVEQKGLLFLSLFFHEFGHLLFAIHRPEMEALVDEIQLAIGEFLRPAFVHNDEKNDQEWRKNELIVTTWYKWAQEFYCDAVGLVIGGESFLYAFSSYFQMGGRDEFYLPEEDLVGHSHPVTAIRIKFLLRRAKKMGYHQTAQKVETEWQMLRNSYGLKEEYYGYFIDDYIDVVETTIDDMLTQSCPIQYDPTIPSPVTLLNEAWQMFLQNPLQYPEWETRKIELFLKSAYLAA